MTEVKIEDLRATIAAAMRHARRRCPIGIAAQKRHQQFIEELPFYLDKAGDRPTSQLAARLLRDKTAAPVPDGCQDVADVLG
jgi:hypothetical protein